MLYVYPHALDLDLRNCIVQCFRKRGSDLQQRSCPASSAWAMAAAAAGLLCKLCDDVSSAYRCDAVDDIISHTENVHHAAVATGVILTCCWPGCQSSRRSFRNWVDHVSKCGFVNKPHFTEDAPFEVTVFPCRTCHERFLTFNQLKTHLYVHMDDGVTIRCPFEECLQSFLRKPSFLAHLRKRHRDLEPHQKPIVPDQYLPQHQLLEANKTAEQNPKYLPGLGCSPSRSDGDVDLPMEEEPIFEMPPPTWYRKRVINVETEAVLLFLALNTRFHVPKSKTMEALEVCQRFTAFWTRSHASGLIYDIIAANCRPENVRETVNRVVERLSQADPLSCITEYAGGLRLGSEYRVTAYLNEHMQFVNPIDIADHPEAQSLFKTNIPRGKGKRF